MAEERARIRSRYPKSNLRRVADEQAVAYCNRLDNIVSSLTMSFTQEVLDVFSEIILKLK